MFLIRKEQAHRRRGHLLSLVYVLPYALMEHFSFAHSFLILFLKADKKNKPLAIQSIWNLFGWLLSLCFLPRLFELEFGQ